MSYATRPVPLLACMLLFMTRACGRIRRAESRRFQSGARGAGFFRSRLRRLDSHSQSLSRQGGAAGIWLYPLPQRLSGHAGGSRPGASEARSPWRQQVQVIYLTVDPERDNAERLKQYLAAFDPSFVGGTGTAAQMAAVRGSYGVTAQKVGSGSDYGVAHSSFVYLITP